MDDEMGEKSETTGRILVIRGGAIGDFVLTFPVLAALRRSFPKAHLEVLAYPHVAQLALAGGLVDGVRSIDARPLAVFFAAGAELSSELKEYFASFSIIISYLFDPDEIFQANVTRCFGGQFLAGAHRPDEGEGVHATEVFLEVLERLAIFDADSVPRLAVQTGKEAEEQPYFVEEDNEELVVALHPGSGSERKNWPEAKWSSLLDILLGWEGVRLVLVGGEAEGDRLERLTAGRPTERVSMVRSRPLVEVAGWLSKCRAYVGHDSGITHLAAALGLPGLVLWGETAHPIWGPRSDRMKALKEPGGLDALGVDRVATELRSLLRLR
jgi:heptosyltransferase-2